jgi:hypothetical protein
MVREGRSKMMRVAIAGRARAPLQTSSYVSSVGPFASHESRQRMDSRLFARIGDILIVAGLSKMQ